MTKFPFHFQSAMHDCVPTCVLAVAEYYGVEVNLKTLRKLLVTDPLTGTQIKSLLNLQHLFSVNLGKIQNVEDVGQFFPFVAYLNRAHAVVVWSYTVDGHKFIVGDPALGIVEMSREDLFKQWEGLTIILRPKDEPSFAEKKASTKATLRERTSLFYQTLTRFLDINWLPMLTLSFIVTLTGLANSFYSLYYAQYLSDYWKFILFVSAYTVVTGVLNWLATYSQSRLSLRYSRKMGERIQEALPHMDRQFYTIGDVSTRYQDGITVISAILGLYRDLPYSIIIFLTSLFFLWKISWLLSLFIVAFLLLLVSLLNPFVQRVQNLTYLIKIKDADVMNRLKNFLLGGKDNVQDAYEESLIGRYKQSIWSIPISSTVSNSAVLPILFVVIFLHWKTGGAPEYNNLLTALMIMNYAVSAGHSLYGSYVTWQTSQPSFHRLKDFLEIDQDAQPKEMQIS